uniref:Apolipoprotein A-IV a n=1 Tax=Myripristis murdjan TaxID=586833 RepID=A0A667XL62_9TELE
MKFRIGSRAAQATELENISQFFENLKNKLTQDLTDAIQVQEVASQAQTFVENKRTELEPVVSQIQDQLRTAAAKVEEQLKPLAENMQAQVQPMVDDFQKQMEDILNKLIGQARAIGN